MGNWKRCDCGAVNKDAACRCRLCGHRFIVAKAPKRMPKKLRDCGKDIKKRPEGRRAPDPLKALEAFTATIERSGGVVVLPEKWPVPSRRGRIENKTQIGGDVFWPDLVDAYKAACKALGRKPVVRKAVDG